MKKLLYLIFACFTVTMYSCKGSGEEELTPVDVRLCCYMEFIGAFGNNVENEVKKVVDNVNGGWTWDSPSNSSAADSTSFGDSILRFDAKLFAEEFRCL